MTGMRVRCPGLLLHDLGGLWSAGGGGVGNRYVRHLNVAAAAQLVLRVAAVRTTLSNWNLISTGVILDHFGFERLVDHVRIAAWAAA